MTALAHAAVLITTGWPTRRGAHLVVGGIFVETLAEPPTDVRVTVRGWPCSNTSGILRRVDAPASNVRRAHAPNGTQLLVIGHLLKLDPVDGLIRIEVCPSQSVTRPFVIMLHATAQILHAIDLAQMGVRVTGRVLMGKVPLLLAETAEAVYAPVPERWHGWHGRRGMAVALSQAAD